MQYETKQFNGGRERMNLDESEIRRSGRFFTHEAIDYRGEPAYIAAKSHLDLVRDFMEAFGQQAPASPDLGDHELRQLRYNLIEEELTELWDALKTRNLVGVADALADLEYVVLGAYIAFGMDGDRLFREVHRSNMTKLGPDGKPVMRADGKVLKPDAYEPPQLETILGI